MKIILTSVMSSTLEETMSEDSIKGLFATDCVERTLSPTTLTWILSGELQVLTLPHSPGSNPVSSCFGISCGSCHECPLFAHTFVPWAFDASDYCHGVLILQYSPGYYPVGSCFGVIRTSFTVADPRFPGLFWSAIDRVDCLKTLLD